MFILTFVRFFVIKIIIFVFIEGRPTVVCQTMRPPSGWLGGIGRRVSLLFFGSMPAHADTVKFLISDNN